MGGLIPGSIFFRLLLGVRKYGKTPPLLVAVVAEYLKFLFVTDAPPEDLLSSPLKDMMGLETKIRLPYGDCLSFRGYVINFQGVKGRFPSFLGVKHV